ncbi:hypothetical protein RSOL_324100 [Rhizoctonia solani AG-3 Rhs1AP]|uniref:Uncharacterized protein n=1 Tax=Rhizoctonia solani AG-3 Rhs1AP TaxID=1086054 RepID=A0A0A1UL90_9AGAM|nr:hypothetical protein RSOL_324100 [Rhizoctonia solani AG-3 Rhs1AP]
MEAPQNGRNNTHEPPGVSFVGQFWGAATRTLTRLYEILKHVLMVYLVVVILRNAISESFPEIPCKHPVSTRYFPHCAHKLDSPGGPIINPDFVTLARLQSRLEYVMEDSARNSLVAVNIKCSDIALRDLSMSVELSSLVGKHTLVEEIKHFVDDAQVASAGLQEFSSHVWASADQIIPLNQDITMALEIGKSLEMFGFFYGIVNGLVPMDRDTAVTHQKRIEDLWLQAIGSLDKVLFELIDKAQYNVGSLQNLRKRLDNIQDMLAKDAHEIHGEEQVLERQLFSEMRELFGLNQGK